jgi:hypothetical protein
MSKNIKATEPGYDDRKTLIEWVIQLVLVGLCLPLLVFILSASYYLFYSDQAREVAAMKVQNAQLMFEINTELCDVSQVQEACDELRR